MQIAITFYGRVPSKKNGKEWVQRGNRKFLVPSRAYTNWERSEVARLKALHHSPKLQGFALVVSPFLPDNRTRDVDNVLASVQDCLKAAGMIKDDKWQVMSSPPVLNQPVIDRVNPRVEVLISYEESIA